eukprot:tig00000615_g2562.t1
MAAAPAPMRVLVSGASGLVGRNLVPALKEKGHSVTKLVRGRPAADAGELSWDPQAGKLDVAALEDKGIDAIVNLSGESIQALRWTEAKKRSIVDSRVRPTRLLAESAAKMKKAPSVFVSAGGVGAYGSRGAEPLTEAAPYGAGFLAEVSRQWEAAAEPARAAGIRTVTLRLAPVLTTRGGVLGQMLMPFSMGLGGPIGDGSQYFPWIALEDAVRAFAFALECPTLSGPVNACAGAVTNAEYTKALGAALARPAFLPLPAFALRLGMGELAEELLLGSQNARPEALVRAGFQFRHPELRPALDHLLRSRS